MTITYPLPALDFWERLRFGGRPEFVPQLGKSQSADAGGNVFGSFRGRPKWGVSVSVEGGRHDANAITAADLGQFDMRDGTFLAYDIKRPFPAADFGGVRLGTASVQVKSKGSNNRSIALKGLPVGYVISKGDWLSILYASTRRFLFKALESAVANGSGETVEFEIQPFLPKLIAVNDAVTLKKPCGKFKIVAGSYRPAGGAGNLDDGASFSMVSVP